LSTLVEADCRRFVCGNANDVSTVLAAGGDGDRIAFMPPAIVAGQLRKVAANEAVLVACGNAGDLKKITKFAAKNKILLKINGHNECGHYQKLANTAKEANIEIAGVILEPDLNEDRFEWNDIKLMKMLSRARLAMDAAVHAGYQFVTELELGLWANADKRMVKFTRKAMEYHFGASLAHLNVTFRQDDLLVRDKMITCCRILGVRQREEGSRQYVVNDGIYRHFNHLLYCDQSILHISSLKNSETVCTLADVLGSSGRDFDVLARNTRLPRMTEGEWMVIRGGKVSEEDQVVQWDEGLR